MDGVVTVEFGLILLVLLPLFFAVGEFYRLSLCDQALARATHLAAMAASRNPSDCETAARLGFGQHGLAAWLFDQDGDGTISFGREGEPGESGVSEVGMEISADDGDLSNGVSFDDEACGDEGSWIQVRTVASVRAPFGTGTLLRGHTSWAVNQE